MKVLREAILCLTLIALPSFGAWAWTHGISSGGGGGCSSCLLIDGSNLLAIDGSGNLLLIQ